MTYPPYISKRLGVHLIGNEFVVNEEIPSNDENKYDFVFLTNNTQNYNGNRSYEASLVSTGRKPNLYGWKIKYIELPGHWFGNRCFVYLVDVEGKDYKFNTGIDNWHFADSECRYIKDALEKVLAFCYENYSADFANLGEPVVEYKEQMKFSEFVQNYYKMRDVIELYNAYSLRFNISTSERDKLLLTRLKQKVSKCIEKAYKISVSL